MSTQHEYGSRVVWTGSRGTGTSGYKAYDRTWSISIDGKAPVRCSNDPYLGGDPTKLNPEDLLLSALAACHMLWYLHFAADAGVVVLSYEDSPVGVGAVEKSGAGRFESATLRPRITVEQGSDLILAERLHDEIHKVCFIARSVSFPINCVPSIQESVSM